MAYVYLVKLFGMHKIGRTDNFNKRIEQLKPAVLIGKKQTNRSRDLEAELHKYFANKRLPQSEWFSLTNNQVKECLALMGLKQKPPILKGPKRPRKATRATQEQLAEYRKQIGVH